MIYTYGLSKGAAQKSVLEAVAEFIREEQPYRDARSSRLGVDDVPPVWPCGTKSGYELHSRERTEVCFPCRDAVREYWAARYVPSPRALAPCGSGGAYYRHLRRGETPCGPGREAHRLVVAADRARKRAGTPSMPRVAG